MCSKMNRTIIIGAGAAGLMCAALADTTDNHIILLDKNEKAGKKIYITGKGRCNVTNACDMEEFFESIVSNRRFMYSSYNAFNNFDAYGFFEDRGVPLKIERGMRVFPESDKSSDIIVALVKACRRNNVEMLLGKKAKDILIEEGEGGPRAVGVQLEDGTTIKADRVVVATGGLSYPSTGSTGDGYKFAGKAGHTLIKCSPSLVALKTKESFVKDMAGLSLKNVSVSVNKNGKSIYSGFGEMLFTHTGVSGPLILTASAICGKAAEGADLIIDLKPALDEQVLDERLVKDFTAEPNKELKNHIRKLLPASMVDVFVKETGLKPDKKAALITKDERKLIIKTLKAFKLVISGLCGYNEAVITKGGVDVKEINPKTMESKKCQGLYFIGEVLDVDALTGGYNLQIAWSTAAACAAAVK